MEMRDIGGFTGAFAGAAITLAQASGQAMRQAAQHRRNLATVGEWSRALDAERTARIGAEREILRLIHHVEMLRLALHETEQELEIRRSL